MKIISYNIRGLGSFEKKKEIQKMVKFYRPWILCVQQTKLEIINDFFVLRFGVILITVTLTDHLWGLLAAF